jgi:hypothetical protein
LEVYEFVYSVLQIRRLGGNVPRLIRFEFSFIGGGHTRLEHFYASRSGSCSFIVRIVNQFKSLTSLYHVLKQDKAICQDEWKFAMGNRDKKIVEYKDLMRKAAL